LGQSKLAYFAAPQPVGVHVRLVQPRHGCITWDILQAANHALHESGICLALPCSPQFAVSAVHGLQPDCLGTPVAEVDTGSPGVKPHEHTDTVKRRGSGIALLPSVGACWRCGLLFQLFCCVHVLNVRVQIPMFTVALSGDLGTHKFWKHRNIVPHCFLVCAEC
jgi:hypothetical protein